MASRFKQKAKTPDLKSMELQTAKLSEEGKPTEAADFLHEVVRRSEAKGGSKNTET